MRARVALPVLALLIGAPPVRAQTGAQFEGMVSSAFDAQPLPGISLRLTRLRDGKAWSAATREDGCFRFGEGLSPEPHVLRATADGFLPTTSEIVPSAEGGRFSIALVLVPDWNRDLEVVVGCTLPTVDARVGTPAPTTIAPLPVSRSYLRVVEGRS